MGQPGGVQVQGLLLLRRWKGAKADHRPQARAYCWVLPGLDNGSCFSGPARPRPAPTVLLYV
jgi:hypothetical protein